MVGARRYRSVRVYKSVQNVRVQERTRIRKSVHSNECKCRDSIYSSLLQLELNILDGLFSNHKVTTLQNNYLYLDIHQVSQKHFDVVCSMFVV